MVCPPRITRCLLWPNATRLEGLCQRSVRHRVRHSFEYSKLWLRRNRASHYPIYTFLSLSIYIYVSHRRICRHVKSTCTIRISADYGNPFNGKSRIRVYKCVYTLAIQFRNLSRGLSCTVIVIDVSPRFFFPQMLQFPMNLSPTPRDRCIPWWYLCFSLETSPLVPRSFRGYPEISCRNPRSQRDPSNNFRFATWKLINNARETV